jgi:hypothetical protein
VVNHNPDEREQDEPARGHQRRDAYDARHALFFP